MVRRSTGDRPSFGYVTDLCMRPQGSPKAADRRPRNLDKECAARSHLPLDEHHLDLGDGLGGVEALRAGLGAIHDGVAAVEPERVLEIVEPLAGLPRRGCP